MRILRAAKESAAGSRSGTRAKQTTEEQLLWTITFALFAAGAVMVYSASSGSAALEIHGDPMGFLKRYLLIGGAGLIAMRLASRVDLDHVRRLTPMLLAGAFVLLLLVKVPGMGVTINGATRWIGPGVLRFQPSEVMKFALVLYAAMLISQDQSRVRDLKSMANPLLWVILAACILIMLQPDMGTDLVICGTMGLMLVASGARLKDLATIAGILAAGILILSIIEPYRMARLTSFLNPGHDLSGAGYQSQQGRIAIGSGGLFGVGLGESVQKIQYMPEAHTDMILAVIGEELGLLGISALSALYIGLIYFGLSAAKNSRDIYARLLAVGITSMVACQALLNFFAVMGMAPLTGVPLPFISYGGCNLIIMLSAMGLLVNVASGRHQARVRVLKGGGRTSSAARPHRTQKVAVAGGAHPGPRGGRRESRNRSGGDGRTRRPGPGRR